LGLYLREKIAQVQELQPENWQLDQRFPEYCCGYQRLRGLHRCCFSMATSIVPPALLRARGAALGYCSQVLEAGD